jgi:hypothetical protein
VFPPPAGGVPAPTDVDPQTIRIFPWTTGCRVLLARYHLGLRLNAEDWEYLRRVCEIR